MSKTWYYRLGRQDDVVGPVSFATLEELVSKGELTNQSSVRKGKHRAWRPIAEIQGLRSGQPKNSQVGKLNAVADESSRQPTSQPPEPSEARSSTSTAATPTSLPPKTESSTDKTSQQSKVESTSESANEVVPDEPGAADPALPKRRMRRALVWGAAMLVLALAVRASGFQFGRRGTPEQRFKAFTRRVVDNLSRAMGVDESLGKMTFGMKVDIRKSDSSETPFVASIGFEETDVLESVGPFTTRYSGKYAFKGRHWVCERITAVVIRRDLPRIGRSSQSRASETTRGYLNSKQRLAESRLKKNMPLGELLRSCNEF